MQPADAFLLAQWSHGSGPIARWAWRRLAAAGAVGYPTARTEVIAIATAASLADHSRRVAAGAAVASWWATGSTDTWSGTAFRHPDLREVVLTHGLLADSPPERWVTAALHNRLLELWEPDTTEALPSLLTDADPAVCEGAEAACAEATEPLLGELWRELDGVARALDPLTRNANEPSPETLEIANRRWAHVDDGRLLAAAVAARTSEHLRPALVAACRERELAPADPAEKAAFYLLTGQPDRYRAADPDGALLRVAYEAASQPERRRLSAAMVGSGDLDLIRMLTGGGDLSAAERTAVVRLLAVRENWPELWRMTLHLPVVEAVTATRSIDGWRPPDEPDRALFEQFARADPGRLAKAVRVASPQVRPLGPWRPIRACAVSPDGSRLAVARGHVFVEEYDLPSGKRIAVHEPPRGWFYGFDTHRDFLVHTGSSIILGQASGQGMGRLACADGQWRDLLTAEKLFPITTEKVLAVAPTRGGFVATVRTPTDTELTFGTAEGTVARRVALGADLGLDTDQVTPGALAAEPDTALLAVGGRELIVLAADASRVIARAPMPSRLRQVAFVRPQSIVTTDDDRVLTRWYRDGYTLTPQATATLPDDPHIIAIPVHNLIAVQGRRKLRFRDATTLEPARAPVGPQHGRSALWCSPVGGHLVLAGSGYTIKVHEPIAVLARRPFSETTPADLAIVERTTAKPGDPRVELLELLRAGLHHRFGDEIVLGFAGITAADHDIALGGTKEPR